MNRVAVVTGGGSGVGASIASHLADRNERVAVLDVDESAARRTAKAIVDGGGRAEAFSVDVSDRSAVNGTLERVRMSLGPIGILVTSAAVSSFVGFEDMTPEQWDRTMTVNLTGAFHCIQLSIPDMVGLRSSRG